MDLATLMFVSYRSMDERVQRAMREAGYDVTVAQSRLAQRIADEGSRLTELADRAQVTKQTASLLVAALEREWTEHLGPELAGQLREGLLKLREITDPYA